MTSRAQRLSMLAVGALALALAAAAALAFASPGERGTGGRGVAVYDLDALDPSAPLYDKRVPA